MGKVKEFLYVKPEDTFVLEYATELLENTLPFLTKRAGENPEPDLVKLINAIENFIKSA
jgi:hypothetical protein